MTDPVDKLPYNAHRLAATERLRGIPRKPLVGHVRIVLERTHRLDDVDSPASYTRGEFGSPGRGVERRGEVDVVHNPADFEVRLAPRDQHLAHRQVRLGAVQVHARLVYLEGNRLALVAHDRDGIAS